MTEVKCDGNSYYGWSDKNYFPPETKDGRIVYKIRPEFILRNRPNIISLDLVSLPHMMYRLFSNDYIDSEEILGMHRM
jgi:hypothetical protein